jgi:hypothetical protein
MDEKTIQKMIFISSPYTHWSDNIVNDNYLKVAKLASKLCSEGQVAISPIVYGHNLLKIRTFPSNWEFWKNFCLTLLSKCDEMIVYKMEGWDKSRGVAEEIKFAELNNITITYVEYNDKDEFQIL